MVEGKPMSSKAYKNLTLEVADEWVKINHPEIRAEWISINTEKQVLVKLFPGKTKKEPERDKDGNIIYRDKKKKDGTIVKVAKTKEVPCDESDVRKLNAFEVYAWLCNKYNMSPEVKEKKPLKSSTVGQW